ncbi:hypothetical protein AB0E69_06015 [Kribbella sp. NPDC026611]|uniref:hypothetical protein n=1 Tax=Kribbella sp. NPDC026611 TaxID=3154911 RepID=UPI0033C89494
MKRLLIALVVAIPFIVAILAVPVVRPGAADPKVALPGGKANWVVAVGGLQTAAINRYSNWVRLGSYVFATDGTVKATWWSWSMRDRPGPAQVAAAFQAAPSGGFTGDYEYDANGELTVNWTRDAAGAPRATLTEHWDVFEPDGKLARVSSRTFDGPAGPVPLAAPNTFSNYSATVGIGYGSNAPIDPKSVGARPADGTQYTGTFVTALGGSVSRLPVGCQDVAACGRTLDHVQSMLPVVDDDGRFHGWVGVETTSHLDPQTQQPDQGYSRAVWAVLDLVAPDVGKGSR